jgi:hypothetical protein
VYRKPPPSRNRVNPRIRQILAQSRLFEALTDSGFVGDIANAAEVSLLPTAQLDALQAPNFTLFTLNFTALRNGTATFQYLGGPVDMATF